MSKTLAQNQLEIEETGYKSTMNILDFQEYIFTCAYCSALRTGLSISALGSPTQFSIFLRSLPVKVHHKSIKTLV